MTEEKIIEMLLAKAYECYKRVFRQRCPKIARMLDRKEPVELNGQIYTCWNELTVATCGRIIADYCPEIEVEIELDGNASTLSAKLSEADAEIIQTKIKDMVV